MKRLLLPRWTRPLGLIIIIPLLIYFFIDPDMTGKEPDAFDFNFPVLFGDSFSFFNQNTSGTQEESIFKKVNLLNELLLTLVLVASWMVAFASLREEDEYTWMVRLESMLLALIINLGLLLIANFLVFGFVFMHVMTFQLFIFPLIFSAVFAFRLQRQKNLSHEE